VKPDVTYVVTPSRSGFTPSRLRAHLTILAAVLWLVAAGDVATTGRYMRTGQVKGTDFVHFYTLAYLSAHGRADQFADLSAQRATQIELVPESQKDWYPPAYGPQVALALTPLGFLSYEHALLVWIAVTAAVYLGLIAVLTRRMTHLRAHAGLVTLAAIAYPPFWNLIIHGQLSIAAVASVVCAYLALARDRRWLAGAALGVLAYKPPLAIPALAVLVFAREWRASAGWLVTAVAQLVVPAVVIGPGTLLAYKELLLGSRRLAEILLSKPAQMHSLRAFWVLLIPNATLALVFFAISACLAIIAAAVIWRRTINPALRMAALVLAIVLAAPHLYVYDVVLLAPVWIWLTDWYLAQPALPAAFGRTLYVGYVAPVLTVVAQSIHVQVSVLCFSALLWWLSTAPASSAHEP
jgi:alpha-1,2-mannosyltransferase